MRTVRRHQPTSTPGAPGGPPRRAPDGGQARRASWLSSKITRALLAAGLLSLLGAGLARARDEELTKLLATLERAESRAALERRLDQDPRATLAALPWTLPEALPGGDWQSAAATKLQGTLAEAVEAAFGRARDKRVFLSAASKDGLPPVVLGVMRGLARIEPGAPSADQGAADTDQFLRDLVTFEDSVEVRALACDALGRVTPTRATAEVLIAALQDEGARSAARRALEALSRTSTLAGWREWARGLPGPTTEVAGPDLVTSLAGTDRRARAERLAAVERALIERPDDTLRQLQATLEEVEALDPAVGDAIRDVVGRALKQAPDPTALLGTAGDAHPIIAAGLGRGIGSRAASASDLLRPDLLRCLVVLAGRTEASVRTETFRVVPALVTALDEPWAERLIPALDDPDLAVRNAAWTTLRALTRQTMQPSSVAWRRWWSSSQQNTPSEAQ